MSRADAEALAQELSLHGASVTRGFDGPKGYVLTARRPDEHYPTELRTKTAVKSYLRPRKRRR